MRYGLQYLSGDKWVWENGPCGGWKTLEKAREAREHQRKLFGNSRFRIVLFRLVTIPWWWTDYQIIRIVEET